MAGPIGRNTLGGRNWEGYSPDPYLTAHAFTETIKGIQSNGVQACIKHLVGNEQETQRFPSEEDGIDVKAVSSNIDDRTMHELYLWPFAQGVKGGAASVMCSYNRINSTYGCENSKVMNGLLKGELGFQGHVVSDWGGTYSGAPSIKGGLDVEMPGGDYFGDNIGEHIDDGEYDESRLDDMIARFMTPYYYFKQHKEFPSIDPSSAILNGFDPNDNPYGFNLSGPSYRDVRRDHATIIRQMGADSAVLLKNVNNSLPLTEPREIGVFGYDADDFPMEEGQPILIDDSPYGYKKGSLPVGGGSGAGRFTSLVSPLSAIKEMAETIGANVQSITDNPTVIRDAGELDPIPDVCLVFAKSWATEGSDRVSHDLDWDSNTVIEKVAEVCSNTIVITHSAGPNIMDFADNPNVTAIIAAHFPGEEIANSIVDVLWGNVNPSGKLPYTIAYDVDDYNAPIVNISNPTDPDAFQANFTEGLFIDYRHFDRENITPRYEFGFGLSYTTFNASSLTVDNVYPGEVSANPPETDIQPGGNPSLYDTILEATCTVTNTGSVDGKAVAQLYLSLPSSAPDGTPVQVLRGYNKVGLAVGESTTVIFPILRRDISYWDTIAQEWIIPEGDLAFHVGFSSRDVQASQSIAVI